MYFKIITLCIVLFAQAKSVPLTDPVSETGNNRIVGGTPTYVEQFPYVASYVYYYPGPNLFIQRCVGSLISSFHVLTTAYCFTGANLNFMQVRAGSTNSLSGGVITTIREVIKHPSYVELPRKDDIAVTVVNFPFIPSNTIGFLYIPMQNTYIPDGSLLQVVSWGFESEQGPQLATLKEIYLFKLPLADCQAVYANSNNVVIDDPVICASAPGRGTCMGDSGAPMAIGDVVVGLSSYYNDCGTPGWPDVFTRIDRYANWILEVAVAPSRDSNSTLVHTATPRMRN